MATITQRSFSGGEISPSLYARVDFSKYQLSLKQCRNFTVLKHGGVANRAGTQYVSETKVRGQAVRFIPFIFNSAQTFVLEFGDQYIRFIQDGVLVKFASLNITGVSTASQAIVTINAHGYSNGDEVYFNNILGPVFLNNRNFIVSDVTANTFKIKDITGTYVSTVSQPSYISGGTSAKIYSITSSYAAADLMDLQYVQSADVITIVGKNYAPTELKRLGATNWTLTTINFKSDIIAPTAIVTPSSTGTKVREYKITAIRKDDFKESNAGTTTAVAITNITKANPGRLTYGGTAYEGSEYYLTVAGMTQVNDRRFIATNVAAGAFDLQGEDSTAYGTFTSGTVAPCFIRFTQDTISAAVPVNLTWSHTDDADIAEYNIYRRDDESGAFGLIGVSKGKSFKDVGVAPDTSVSPPSERNPFIKSSDYPSAITYFQQRLFLANTTNDVEKIFSSKIGDFKNFGTSSPIQDDDAITFKISGRQVNTVKHLLDLGKLVAFTQGGEYIINGNDSSVITPTSVNAQQQSYNGASRLAPLVINDTALYVQDRGSVVRDIAFKFESDGYTGDDLTIFAGHLFRGFELVDWAYQQIPDSIVWAVRDDGVLLGLTYLKEQRILAWHRHDFDGGLIENVCTVPEGDEDVLYVVVNRSGVRSMERLTTRQVFDVKDCIFMDSSATYDGRNTSATTMTLSGGTTWAYDEELTLTSSVGFFTASDVGNRIDFSGPLRLTISSYVSATQVKVFAHKTVPVSQRAVAQTEWSKAVDVVSGLYHLEGKNVSIFADGFVVASPYNPANLVRTVTNGQVTLDKPYSYIHVGLPYISDIETLNVDVASGESIADKAMLVTSVNIFVEKSRGGFIGTAAPVGNLLTGLFEFKIRNAEDYDSPVDLRTGTMEAAVDSQFNDNGRVFLRQVDPEPFTVLSMQPAGMYPAGG